VFLGPGLLCFGLLKRVISQVQKLILIVVGAFLILAAAVFAIPVVNQAVITVFWFLFTVGAIIYVMIWCPGCPQPSRFFDFVIQKVAAGGIPQLLE